MRREKNEDGPPRGQGLQETERKSSPRGRGEPRPYKDGRRGTQEHSQKWLCHRRKRKPRTQAKACATGWSQKIQEGGGGFFGLLFEDPVAGVFQDEHGGVGGDEFHLLAEESAVGFFPADG